MSRVQTLFIPEVERFEAYVKSLLHMARTLDNSGRQYNRMKHVVVVGSTARTVEAYVKTTIGSNTVPDGVFCLGLNQAPDLYKKYDFGSAHVVLMFDLMYTSESAIQSLAHRLFDIILTLKQRPEDRELKNLPIHIVGQNWKVWDAMMESGAGNAANYECASKGLQFAPNQTFETASCITFDQLLTQDPNIYAKHDISIGREFTVIDHATLIQKLHNIKWVLQSGQTQHKLILDSAFQRILFEQYLCYEFQGL